MRIRPIDSNTIVSAKPYLRSIGIVVHDLLFLGTNSEEALISMKEEEYIVKGYLT